MIGKIVGHYEILEKLGEGGMGVVYKAEDTKLKRMVALKFLPDRVNRSETDKARFLQEAQAAAGLNHPNICTIYGVEEHDGHLFIAMECIDGGTLRERLPLAKTEEAVTLAIQIGEALQEAHARGIVHRDIKAENIMLTAKNQIKVMDFGLAKLKGSVKLTRTSSTIGTLAYMAPEQIQGGEADTRSDIFSFGVVFYELLTGHTPFRGSHEAAVMYSILNEEPEPVEKFLPDASPELVHILSKALDKDPDLRYQSVADMVADLRRSKRDSTRVAATRTYTRPVPTGEAVFGEPAHTSTGTLRNRWMLIGGAAGVALLLGLGYLFIGPGTGGRSGAAERKMLVVLPFENLGSSDKEYFADGITEEITGKLSGLSGLGVIATTSARQYKRTSRTIKEIAAELGVGYVLQGTIRWSPGESGQSKVRVSPALIRVDDGTQIWSESFDAIVADVFSIQADVASQVAGAMGVSLLNPEKAGLDKRPTENSEAYDLYLRGNEYFRRSYDRKDFEIALDMYGKAVEQDPSFALAWACLAEAHAAMYWFFYDHTEDRVMKTKSAADRALRLDPLLSESHMALGYYYYWCRLHYDEALKEFATALKGKPNDGRLLLAIGAVQRRQGKMREAAESMTRAIEVDPRRSEYLYNIAQTYQLMRDYAKAEDYISRAISLSPDLLAAYETLIMVCMQNDGTTGRARTAMQKAMLLRDFSTTEEMTRLRVLVDMWDGRQAGALRTVDTAFTRPLDSQFHYLPPALASAEVRAVFGDNRGAIAAFEQARRELERMISSDPLDARYRSSFGIALAGLGRKREAIAAGRKATELLPVEQEAWRGSYRLIDLARIYTMVGEKDSAIALLNRVLSMPSDLSRPELRADPRWSPLRGHPDFTKLVASR